MHRNVRKYDSGTKRIKSSMQSTLVSVNAIAAICTDEKAELFNTEAHINHFEKVFENLNSSYAVC